MMKKKVIIAMSGGVDSSAAAYLLRSQGHECAGFTMKLLGSLTEDSVCGSEDDVKDARKVAEKLDMPFYDFDFSDEFREEVMERFVSAYEQGHTPNPCIYCNRYMKFGLLYEKAKELGYDYVATGHYARVAYDEERGRWLLKKALDPKKDQSYMLCGMTQEQLAHAIFPLGGMDKSGVRDLAESQGMENARKRESQDICFVPDGSYAEFIEEFRGKTYPEGDFTDMEGNVLGRHKGIIRYTVGQRKGLGLSLKKPGYVCHICPENNTIVIGDNSDLFTTKFQVKDLNLIAFEDLYAGARLKVRVRYHQAEQWAHVIQTGPDTLEVEFEEPQRAITKGQAAVLYDGDIVAGGGIIC